MEKIISFFVKSVLNGVLTLYHSWFSRKVQHDKIILICKIIDDDLFNGYFPEFENVMSRVQPMWEYSQEKNCIKIKLEEPLLTNCLIQEFLDTLDLDIPFFESFCDLYLYIDYTINSKRYINVYEKGCTINLDDFKLHETSLMTKYKNILWAIVNKNIYITRYFKMFLNNRNPVTCEMIELYSKYNFDKIKLNDKTIVLNETI
jgi:hypothetical protein